MATRNKSPSTAGEPSPQEAERQPRLWRSSPPPPRDHGHSFVPGFEPSAPPLPPDHFDDQPGPRSPPPRPTRPVDYLRVAFRRFWLNSHTVLRLDLRSSIRVEGPVISARDPGKRPPNQGRYAGQAGRADDYSDDWEATGPSQGWLQGVEGGGVKVKLMQIFDFPNKETGEPSLPWNLNFGFGARIDVDRRGHLEPQMRLRADHVSLFVLPFPLLELRGKWPLGGTKLAINVHYRIPVLHLPQFWMSPSAQLRLNLFNPLGTGFHLSPGGLEFDEHVVNIGEHTTMRASASVDFPRAFPVREGEQPIRIHVHRLGVKTRIA